MLRQRHFLLVLSVAGTFYAAFPEAANAQVIASSPATSFTRPAGATIVGQIDFGGRVNTVEGDEARQQRFRDLRDGAFINIPLLYRETEKWVLSGRVWNGGYADQRYEFRMEQPGRLRVSFLYDQTPTFVSSITSTPYTPSPGTESGVFQGDELRIPDGVQAGIQTGTVNFRNAMENLASADFNSRYRRDTVAMQAGFSFAPNWDAELRFANIRKQGNMPYGASFAFNLAVEVPLELDTTTNEWGALVSWSTPRAMARLGFDSSNFTNNTPVLIWDNPIKATDSTNPQAYTSGNGTSQGRMALWPTSTMNQVNGAARYRLGPRTSVNGSFAYSFFNQDEPLLPHTINTVIPAIPLERSNADTKATSANLAVNFDTRALRFVNLNARYRFTNFDNRTTHFSLLQPGGEDEYVRFDQVSEPFTDPAINKFGPEPYGFSRQYADVDASFTPLPYSALRIGYGFRGMSPHFRVYEKANENLLRAGYDLTGHQLFTLRAEYEFARRRGSDIRDINNNAYPDALEAAGEAPTYRHYDIAERDRNRFTFSASAVPISRLDVNASISWIKDDFNNDEVDLEENELGLQDYKTRQIAFGGGFTFREGIILSAGVNFENLTGFQRNRNANTFTDQLNPLRNWTVDEDQKGRYFEVGLDVLRGIPRSEARFLYSFNDYEGRYLYTIGPGYAPPTGTTVWPSQLPDITSQENSFLADYRYYIRRNVAVGFVYWFSRYEVEDWAFSPEIVSGVAQPPVQPEQVAIPAVNGILLNYLYRPYTAHTGWVRVTYLF